MADFTRYVLSFSSLCCVFVSVQAPDPTYIYKRVGDSVTLQCNNVIKEYTECSSTTWIYSSISLGTIELIQKGKRRLEKLRGSKASRLSLQPDCFLNISNITVGDAGRYVCQQYDSRGQRHGVEENTDLFVLSGITQEDVLTCSAHSYDGACGVVSLRWSDQGTSDQMSQQETPGQCVVRRPNTQPLDSAGLRCLLMKDGVEKTSVDFASKDQKTHSQTNITSGAPGGKGPSTSKEHFIYLAVAVGTVLLVLIVAVLVLKKSTGNKQSPPMCVEDPDTMGSPGQGEPTQCLSYVQGEPDGGLLYASIEHRTGSRKARPPSVEEGGCEGDETVTYSTVSKLPANVPEHS
ncbi:uncharacterized protein LOC115547695 isoform X2 [Gadus morhua]|uniref:uncharacterized protein LOC115547695 isoform X2 n=1 Tax=Gadus morhua TaxID=8049 RepID=UPI0011B480D8|nr:uncharacterized protein LOC115547695 isoform X2 [Gadus morhua]